MALHRALVPGGLSAGETALAFALGLVVWPFTEYAIHRFVFHFELQGHHPAIDPLTQTPDERYGVSSAAWDVASWHSSVAEPPLPH